jgi:competence protein ComEC
LSTRDEFHESDVLRDVVVPVSARFSPFTLLAGWLEAERESWFLWVPVCLGLGVAAYFWLPVEPSVLVALSPMPGVIVLKILLRRTTLGFVFASALFWFACGFSLSKLRTEWVRAPVLERQLTGVEVRGFVDLVEPKPTKGQRITLRVTRIGTLPADKLPRRVRIRTMGTLVGLRPGDAVRLKATLGAPAEPSQPGGFDFGRQAWYLGIGGVGYAMAAAELDPEAGPLPWQMWFTAAIEKVRLGIGRAVITGLAGETGGIANALITGERGGISAATDTAYRDSGLYHILSISGLHMVVMAGAFFFTVRFTFAAVPAIALRYPIKKWAAVAAALGALGYLLISGSSFATVRSYVQISILFVAMMVERPAIALRNVALAALGLLIVWPESLFDAGFQMSFAAVVSLISGYEAIRRRQERLGRADIERGPIRAGALFIAGVLGSTVMATAAVAPIAAYQFHTSQQYGALANLVALPLCDLFVMPLALATLLLMPFGLEAIPLYFAGFGIDAMTWIAYAVAKLPGAAIAVVAIPTSAFVAMLAGGLWLLLWKTRWRLLGLPVVALGLALTPTLQRPDVLVGRDGKLIAARSDKGALTALPAPRSLYELARWLEADGDARVPKTVAIGTNFGCDGTGCTTVLKGQRLAVTHHASALAEDCKRASILVLNMPRPKGCTKPLVVIDPAAIRNGGAHGVIITQAGIRVETVAGVRGERPWSLPPAMPVIWGDGTGRRVPRLTQFAIQAALALGQAMPRPEDEDDSGQGDAMGGDVAGDIAGEE